MINNLLKYTVLALFFVMSFTACSDSQSDNEEKRIKIDKPSPFVERDKIVDLIIDLELAEAAVKRMASYGESTAKTSTYYYDYMFEKWGITFQEYNDIINYYSQDPVEMENIYADVIGKLSEMQSKVRNQ